MKTNVLLIFFVYFTFQSYAQKEDYQRPRGVYFLDFNFSPPIKNEIGNGLGARDCVSDKYGNIMLYKSNNQIFNAQNQLIANIPDEVEDKGKLNSILIPKPECENIVYLLQTIAIARYDIETSFYEIDVNKSVNENNKIKTILPRITGLTGIIHQLSFRHSNLKDFWIYYYIRTGEGYTFDCICLLATKNGIEFKKKLTNISFFVSSSMDLTKMIVFLNQNNDSFSEFNSETGELEPKFNVPNRSVLSPDGTKIFSVENDGLYQYNISNNQLDTKNKKVILSAGYTPMQTPDGALYCANFQIINPNALAPICFVKKIDPIIDYYHFFRYTFHNPHPTVTLDNYCLGRTRLAYKGIKVKSVEWKIKDEDWVLGDTIYYDFKTDGDQMLQLRVSYLNNTVELSNQYFFLGKSPDSQPVLQASNFKTDICVNSPQIYLAKGEKTSLFTWSAGEGASIATSASGDTATVSWNAAGQTTLKLTECSFMGCPGKSVEQGINVHARPQLSVPAALCAFENGIKIPLQIKGGTPPWTLKYWENQQSQTSTFDKEFSMLQVRHQNLETKLIFQSLQDSFDCTDLHLSKTINIHPFIEPIELKNIISLTGLKNSYTDTLRAKQTKIYSVEQAKPDLIYHWQTNAGQLKCLDKNCTSVSIQTTEIGGTYWAKVSATATNTCTSDTVLLKLEIQALGIENISVPNVFTPNGDGVNDVFKFDVPSSISYQLNIYNRWGQMVFEGTEKSDFWAGKFQENKCAVSSYFYVLKLVSGSEIMVIKGFVALQ